VWIDHVIKMLCTLGQQAFSLSIRAVWLDGVHEEVFARRCFTVGLHASSNGLLLGFAGLHEYGIFDVFKELYTIRLFSCGP